MTRTFNVADHFFSLSIPDEDQIWGKLHNYDPFVEECVSEPLFSLSLADRITEAKKELILSGKSEEPSMPRLDIYSTGSGLLVEMAPVQEAPVCGWLSMSSDYKRATLVTDGTLQQRTFAVNNSLMLLYTFSTVGRKTLAMHSSVVVSNGYGYMFLGVSGAGKSTHSRMWLENVSGSRLLNDDNPVLRVLEDGSIRIYGTPWSGKTPCYKKWDVPVGAMVQITKAPNNEIHKLDVLNSYIQVYTSCSGLREDSEVDDLLHETIDSVISSIPVYELKCRADAEAAAVCSAAVTRHE